MMSHYDVKNKLHVSCKVIFQRTLTRQKGIEVTGTIHLKLYVAHQNRHIWYHMPCCCVINWNQCPFGVTLPVSVLIEVKKREMKIHSIKHSFYWSFSCNGFLLKSHYCIFPSLPLLRYITVCLFWHPVHYK